MRLDRAAEEQYASARPLTVPRARLVHGFLSLHESPCRRRCRRCAYTSCPPELWITSRSAEQRDGRGERQERQRGRHQDDAGNATAVGAELLGETLAQLNDLTPRPQHDVDATFAPVLNKEDGLIDWSQSAFAIERRVRGLQPWPTAYTSFNSKGLTIWSAEPSTTANANAAPGEIIVIQRDELVVSCGEQTALRLIEIQPEARKRIAARDFINGMHPKVGDRFG